MPVAVVALATAPLAPAATAPTCPSVTPKAVFSQWGDQSLYVLSEGGAMEDTTFWSGATLVSDNDPYRLAGVGRRSLRLTDGSNVKSGWVCQGNSYPTIRFMVRNTGTSTSTLDVRVYADGLVPVTLASITAGPSWVPSPIITVPTGLFPDGVSISGLQIAFAATGAGADFRVDDFFIDPRSRG